MEQKTSTIRLTLLGGANEVGGNIVLLEDEGYNNGEQIMCEYCGCSIINVK